MYKVGFLITVLFLLFTACQNATTKVDQEQTKKSQSVLPEVKAIKEPLPPCAMKATMWTVLLYGTARTVKTGCWPLLKKEM
jgi:hypothetical protein